MCDCMSGWLLFVITQSQQIFSFFHSLLSFFHFSFPICHLYGSVILRTTTNIYILSSNYSNKIFSNYFLVIISISIVLFLISSFTLIALNSEKIINDFKENIPVIVFIKDQSNKIELSKFEKNLKINNTIKKFDFVSKKDAANKLSEEIGEDFIDYLGYNPLYDSYDIFFKTLYYL